MSLKTRPRTRSASAPCLSYGRGLQEPGRAGPCGSAAADDPAHADWGKIFEGYEFHRRLGPTPPTTRSWPTPIRPPRWSTPEARPPRTGTPPPRRRSSWTAARPTPTAPFPPRMFRKVIRSPLSTGGMHEQGPRGSASYNAPQTRASPRDHRRRSGLLIYHVSDGWGSACATFLGVPLPRRRDAQGQFTRGVRRPWWRGGRALAARRGQLAPLASARRPVDFLDQALPPGALPPAPPHGLQEGQSAAWRPPQAFPLAVGRFAVLEDRRLRRPC